MPDTLHTLVTAFTANLLTDGHFQVPQCTACGNWDWYPRTLCLHCGATGRDKFPVLARGAVHTWTRVHRTFPPVVGIQLPYIVAIVALDEAREVRVPTVFRADGNPDPVFDQKLEIVGCPDAPGRLISRPLICDTREP